jgi:hypothetical protein
MIKQIWKFPLQRNGDIEMPKGAEILCVQEIGELPYMYALVDPNAEKEKREYKVFATGQDIETEKEVQQELVNATYKIDMRYIGTFKLFRGNLVYHVFEILK